MAVNLNLSQVPKAAKNHLFLAHAWNPDWLNKFKVYILETTHDDILLQPHDNSYNFPLLNLSMRHILEVLAACFKFPISDMVFNDILLPHVENIMDSCNIVEEDRKEFIANFMYFLELYETRRNYVINSFQEEIELNNDSTSSFRGSIDHLIFGKIVGDALGLHPVLGALMNPTGGICGPNNSNIFMRTIGLIPIIRKHSICHDAAGYLKLYHNVGPGYRYFTVGAVQGRLNPIKGHECGLQFPMTGFMKCLAFQYREVKKMYNEMSNSDFATFLIISFVVLILIYLF